VAPGDLVMVPVAAALGLAAAAIPVWAAYRQDVARNLAAPA
jgi:hypothetical protein